MPYANTAYSSGSLERLHPKETVTAEDYNRLIDLLDATRNTPLTFAVGPVAPGFAATGLPGANNARFVGGMTVGPPTTGSFLAGDFIVDAQPSIWYCNGTGSPGNWVQLIGGAGTTYQANEVQSGILVGGGGMSDHFMGSSLAAAWTRESVPTQQVISNSAMGIQVVSFTSQYHYTRSFAPSGAFRVEARLTTDASQGGTSSVSLFVKDNTTGQSNMTGALVTVIGAGISAYDMTSGSSTAHGNYTQPRAGAPWTFVRIDRNGSNTWTAYGSADRNIWTQVGTWTHTVTVAKVGFSFDVGSANSGWLAVDFIDWVS